MSTRLYNVMNSLVSRLENFDDTIKTWMNTNHRWRLVGQEVGSTAITLPHSDTSWDEVHVKCFMSTQPQWTFDFHLIREELPSSTGDSGAGIIQGAYASASNSHMVGLLACKTYIQLFSWVYGGNSILNNSTVVKVYVR